MKRILVALFLLALSVAISIYSTEKLKDNLDMLEETVLSLSEKNSSNNSLKSNWDDSEKMFALVLDEEKYKNLERHVFLSSGLQGEDLEDCYREILYEIEVIRESQQFFIENIL